MEALSDDNLHGCKSSDRKHPRKLRKYQGVPVKSFMEAGKGKKKGKKTRMRQKRREREKRKKSERG